MTDPYTEVASVDGCWTAHVVCPPTEAPYIQSTLRLLAGQCPVSAAAVDDTTGLVHQLIIYRDPSRTRDTPTIPDCDEMIDELAAMTGWDITRDTPATPRAGALVGLGLREGFAPGAPVHAPGEVGNGVLEQVESWRPCRLMSARQTDDHIEWHDEPGVLLWAPQRLVPEIATAAARLGQVRFVVTDYIQGRTYALRIDEER